MTSAIKQHAPKFLKSIEHQPKTRVDYGYVITQFVNHIMSRQIKQIKMLHIEQYLASPTSNNSRPSPHMFNMRLAALRSLFNYLEQHELIDKNPTRFIKTHKIKNTESTRTLTHNELRYILRRTTGDSQHAIFIICNTGLRISELASIRRNNIKKEYVNNHHAYVLSVVCKGSIIRRLELNEATTSLIFKRFNKYKYLANTPLFPSVQLGQCMRPSSLAFKIKKQLKRIGFANVTPHWFRHTFAQHLQNQNLNTQQIQSSLGHKNLNTTQKYLHRMSIVPTQTQLMSDLTLDEPDDQ